MTEAILVLAVVAGLACPVHMWWQHRRGRQAACCPPRRSADDSVGVEALSARRARLSAQIAELERTAKTEPAPRT